jgi:hypothetical protein
MPVLQLTLPDATLEVTLLRRARKSIGIRIVSGRVEVAAPPRVPLAELQRLLEKKRDWIVRHWRRQTESIARRQDFPESFCLSGEPMPLLLDAAPLRQARLTAGGLQVGGSADIARAQVAGFLQREAAALLPERLAALARHAVRSPSGLALSRARTRWGSCNHDGMIRLNWRLIQAPHAVQDYVIAHELAHLRHMNHSAAFWAETARLYPDWQSARAWLKRNGEGLFIFG